MKFKVREFIDITKPVDLHGLPPLQQLTVAIRKYIYDYPAIAKRREKKEIEKQEKERIFQETCKDVILSRIFEELVHNKNSKVRELKEVAVEQNLKVPRSYDKFLPQLLQSTDFKPFEVSIVQADPDLLIAFPNLPIIISVRKKEV